MTLITLLVALIFGFSTPATLFTANDNPGVLPPEAKPLGVSYGDWAGRWLNWIFSFPEGESPLLIDNCNAQPGGKVFLVPHTLFDNTPLETWCTVATGTMIFASAGGVFSWEDEPGVPTEEELRESALAALQQSLRNPRIIIDGRELQNIEDYFVVSDAFDFVLPEGNLLGLPPVDWSRKAVVAGWHAMLTPLPPGEHTIVVHDELVTGEVAEVIAHLTVVPGH